MFPLCSVTGIASIGKGDSLPSAPRVLPETLLEAFWKVVVAFGSFNFESWPL